MNEQEIRFIEPKMVQLPDGTTIRLCGLDYCSQPHYSYAHVGVDRIALCKYHYDRNRTGRELRPVLNWWNKERPTCPVEGCEDKAVSIHGVRLCSTHVSQMYRFGEIRPVRWKKNAGYTDTGRVCKKCGVEKDIEEFYDRNRTKIRKDGTPCTNKSTTCKDCFRADVAARKRAKQERGE